MQLKRVITRLGFNYIGEPGMKFKRFTSFLAAAIAGWSSSATASLLAVDHLEGGTSGAALGAGGTSSFGWAADWTNQTGSGQFSAGTSTDLTTNTFEPSGLTLGFLGTGSERTGRNLDLSGGGNFASYLDGNGKIGADGTKIYISYLLGVGDGVSSYYGFELHRNGNADGNRVLQVATENNPAMDLRAFNTSSTGEDFYTQTSRLADTFVLEITFGAADNDQARVYVNPAYYQPQSSSTPLASITATNLAFDRISFGQFASKFIDFDDIRVGETWADVVGTTVPEPNALLLLAMGGILLKFRRK